MRGFAYALLIVVFISLIFEPFMETIQVFVEKAKMDSAVRNAGKLALMRSVKDENRADLKSDVELDTFRERFNDAFATALNLEVIYSSGNKSCFNSKDGRFNDFTVIFVMNTSLQNKNYCTIKASSKYKYKTRYLKVVEANVPSLTAFNMNAERKFLLDIVN